MIHDPYNIKFYLLFRVSVKIGLSFLFVFFFKTGGREWEKGEDGGYFEIVTIIIDTFQEIFLECRLKA